EYRLQSRRDSNDLLKHRCLVDFLAQSDVFLLQPFFSSFAVFDIGGSNIPTNNVPLVIEHRVGTSQKPAVTSIELTQPQLQLVRRPCRDSTVKIIQVPRSIIRMNERTGRRRLPPLFKTKAQVIKCDAVDMKTFAVGSEDRNELWREVQHLLELCFLPPDPFFGSLALGDIRYRPDKLKVARLIFHCVSQDVNILDRIVGQQEPIFQIAILPLTGCMTDLRLNHSLVVRMNPFKDRFHGGFGVTVVSKNAKSPFGTEHLPR